MHTKVFTPSIGSVSRRGNAMGWGLSASVCLGTDTDTDPNTAAVCITQQFLAVQRSGSSDG